MPHGAQYIPVLKKEQASEILPGRLFLGGEWDAREAGQGSNPFGITHILNVAHVPILGQGIMQNGVFAEWVPISDDGADDIFGPPMSLQEHKERRLLHPGSRLIGSWWHCRSHLCKQLLEDGNARVLVHCEVGVNRSATIVIAWLMEAHGFTLDSAYDHVEAKRPLIDPVGSHYSQLEAFERALQIARRQGGTANPPCPPLPSDSPKNSTGSAGTQRKSSAWQVTVTVPPDSPPGTKLLLPVRGGETKLKVRVPEGVGPGSSLVLTELVMLDGTTDWDVSVKHLVPWVSKPEAKATPMENHDGNRRASAGVSVASKVGLHADARKYSVGEEVISRYVDGNWYKARIAEARQDGTYIVNWNDTDTRDRVKSNEEILRI
jgi:protein-tyrosine phosphatase